VLDYVKQENWFPSIESSITYITKLYNEECNLLGATRNQKCLRPRQPKGSCRCPRGWHCNYSRSAL
jgi:hypothetical protein